MKSLTAKVLIANFVDNSDSPFENTNSYEVLEFSNGLIMVESHSTNEWFFTDRDSIEGCGHDRFIDCTDTGEIKKFTSFDIAQSWGKSEDLECGDLSCLELIKELVH